MPPAKRVVAIVEDDDSTRRSIERLLQASGYATIAFASAEQFLQCSGAQQAMALVLDIHLGGMSGIELRRRLASAGSTLPVVFITADDNDLTHREAVDAGCVALLLKPFDPTRLTEVLARVGMC